MNIYLGVRPSSFRTYVAGGFWGNTLLRSAKSKFDWLGPKHWTAEMDPQKGRYNWLYKQSYANLNKYAYNILVNVTHVYLFTCTYYLYIPLKYLFMKIDSTICDNMYKYTYPGEICLTKKKYKDRIAPLVKFCFFPFDMSDEWCEMSRVR